MKLINNRFCRVRFKVQTKAKRVLKRQRILARLRFILTKAKEMFLMKIALGIAIGGAIGFAIGYFGKCASGVCPLTSNPVISMVLGAMIGAMIAFGR